MLNSILIFLVLACNSEPTETPGTEPAAGAETPAAAETPSLEAPADVAAAPADAKTTESGLAYKVIKKGPGGEAPTEWDKVKVHYIGWTTDGENFDSSYKRNQPASFPLKGVIAGWTEGLQLMETGDTVRFWIPEELAYKGMPGKPAGMLVFDVELIEVIAGPRPPEAPESVQTAPGDAKTLTKGIQFKELSAGEGEVAKDGDLVEFQMSAWNAETGEFEFSTAMRGRPLSGRVGEQMAVFDIATKNMKPGGKAVIWATKDQVVDGRGNPADSDKTFVIELVSAKSAPPAPKSVAKPPAKAKKTESGLAYMELAPGTGTEHPTATSRVKVHYSGWTTDGKLFDSSVQRGEPTSFGLNQVIPGWTEGLQLMVPGQKMIFWIPEEIAYAGKPGRPAGMLVFEVELLEIVQAPAPQKIELTPPSPH
ncbi:MAG: FKBP-type peptidyl-prolyl cis-trans isomerase [Myxococcota bacterium]|nr:FKBP-type peptidyl-prolyl cis-trans isomerase [Myxococcota bacterium]